MSPMAYYEAINVRPILLKPKSRGFILLNSTHPIWGQPLIYPRFFTKGNDLQVLIEGITNTIIMYLYNNFKQLIAIIRGFVTRYFIISFLFKRMPQ